MEYSLTEFEKKFFIDFDTLLEFRKWYRIDPNRPDAKEITAAVKKRIDIYNDCYFSEDLLWFRKVRIETDQQNREYWDKKIADYQNNLIKKNYGIKPWPIEKPKDKK